MLQIGVVGVAQSLASSQPPHAPLLVHTVLPGQLSLLPVVHLTHVNEVPSQMGVVPMQPELVAGSQAAQRPLTHSVLPSARFWQAVLSTHSAHALWPAPFAVQ